MLVFDQLAIGGQAGASARIENYLGFPTGISGADEIDLAGLCQKRRVGYSRAGGISLGTRANSGSSRRANPAGCPKLEPSRQPGSTQLRPGAPGPPPKPSEADDKNQKNPRIPPIQPSRRQTASAVRRCRFVRVGEADWREVLAAEVPEVESDEVVDRISTPVSDFIG